MNIGSGWLRLTVRRFSHVFSLVPQGRVEDIVTDGCVEVYDSMTFIFQLALAVFPMPG